MSTMKRRVERKSASKGTKEEDIGVDAMREEGEEEVGSVDKNEDGNDKKRRKIEGGPRILNAPQRMRHVQRIKNLWVIRLMVPAREVHFKKCANKK
ncbi:ALI_collapsed_G0030950.mRNA.1.CDS.1 [Saccharomyces cerevisiae]|nr:ALI_collapsed_G0030950.mRNA.1.CDS.1 [Saccharomyces cerevisiae]